MLWVIKSMFFLYFYPRFSKMDIYKCPILKKGLRELKFSYIITLWASAFPFCGGYLYDLIIYWQRGHVATIMVWIYNLLKIVNIFKTCPKRHYHVYEKLLSQNWDIFWKPLVANYCAPFRRNIPTDIEKSRPIWYSPSHRTILENRKKYWRQNNCCKYLWKLVLYFFK